MSLSHDRDESRRHRDYGDPRGGWANIRSEDKGVAKNGAAMASQFLANWQGK
jgi:hypothetical protein